MTLIPICAVGCVDGVELFVYQQPWNKESNDEEEKSHPGLRARSRVHDGRRGISCPARSQQRSQCFEARPGQRRHEDHRNGASHGEPSLQAGFRQRARRRFPRHPLRGRHGPQGRPGASPGTPAGNGQDVLEVRPGPRQFCRPALRRTAPQHLIFSARLTIPVIT
jgi:hypothetical protein